MASCDCWGDPHCTTFDRSVLHFMGDCTYVMSRDGCKDGLPVEKPTFELQQTLWHLPGWHNKRVTFVKELKFIFKGIVSGFYRIRVVCENTFTYLHVIPNRILKTHAFCIL